MKFIIEHLEPRLFKWCIIEYTHISEIVGKDNLIFTNIRENDVKKLEKLGEVHTQSVKEMTYNNSCVLDPFAKKELDANDKFDYMILGGILGDEPMKKRTEIELTNFIKAEVRHLGKKQMSTDTAVYVSKYIIDGGKFSDIKFQDEIEIDIREGESIQLPFRYVLIDGKPMLPNGLVEFLKKRKDF
jgi:ribosome biogenesis SPOUT family RNA methylase Rps3